MKKLCIVLSLILIVGCQPPDEYYYSQIENIELFKNKILLPEPANHPHSSKGLNIEDIPWVQHPNSRYRGLKDDYSSEGRKKREIAYKAYQAFLDAKYLMVMDLVLTYLDDSTDDMVRERILWYQRILSLTMSSVESSKYVRTKSITIKYFASRNA